MTARLRESVQGFMDDPGLDFGFAMRSYVGAWCCPAIQSFAVTRRTRSPAQAARLAESRPPITARTVDAIIALTMALDRFENQPEPTRLLGWL